MDDRRIARALAGTTGPDAEERAARRRARWRILLRTIAVFCLIAGAALLALLLRPLPAQAELQYTQGQIRQAAWTTTRWPRFEIALNHESRAYVIDTDLAERNGRTLADIAKPGMTARIGYASGPRAWDLAIEDREIYSLADIRARTARESRPYWFAAPTLLGLGLVLWLLAPRPRHRSHRDRRG
jgi:hypothetical protein